MERRRYTRAEASQSVLYSSDIYPRANVASTLDLSRGGARIRIPYSLIAGEAIDLAIAVHPRLIKCRGKVVYVEWLGDGKMEAGIEFEGLSFQDRQYLGQYLLSRGRRVALS